MLTGSCVPSLNKDCLDPTKQGKISGQLQAQTLTLGLNLRINNGLGNIPLEAGKYLTTQKWLNFKEGSGGINLCTLVNTVTTESPTWCNQITEPGPFEYFQLPVPVLHFMEANHIDLNIAGLYGLANKVPGQAVTLPAGLTLTDIAKAVNMINNAFDGCRIFVVNLDEMISCRNPCVPKSALIDKTSDSGLLVYPNPFNDKVTFDFTSGKDTHAVLEIHNLLGQKIITLLDREVDRNVINRVDYEPAGEVSGIYFYRLILGDSVQTGRLIYKK